MTKKFKHIIDGRHRKTTKINISGGKATEPESSTKKYDNEYKVTLKVFPSTVENEAGKATIGDIKIVYDSNHRINSTPDQVDYYLLELARYLRWLTTKEASDETKNIHSFFKNEDKSMSFIKNVPKESELGDAASTTPPAARTGGSKKRLSKR